MIWLLILILSVCLICSRAEKALEAYEIKEKREKAADKIIRQVIKTEQAKLASPENTAEIKKAEAWLFDLGF